jgi:hypothetical protein
MKLRPLLLAAATAVALSPAVYAWDYEGHRLVNEVALAALPPDFPRFVTSTQNAERIAFLAGEPDRWRNSPSAPLQQVNGMDHYLDMEEIPEAGLEFNKLPSFRYDFAVQFATGRAAHAANFAPIDPERNADHSREWAGFVPWAITEQFGKLQSAFSYLRAYEELGTREEIANARANIVYVMGVMGHYVGDAAQPLHTTIHHHGWVGPNPNGYTTWTGIHAWVDGGFIAKAGVNFEELKPRVTPAQPIALATQADGRDPMFVTVCDYLAAQHRRVEPLYQLEKEGKLGHHEQPITPEGRDFIDGQIVAGGEMLASIWVTAWKTAPVDNFLRNSLANRKARAAGLPPPPPSPLPAPKRK